MSLKTIKHIKWIFDFADVDENPNLPEQSKAGLMYVLHVRSLVAATALDGTNDATNTDYIPRLETSSDMFELEPVSHGSYYP